MSGWDVGEVSEDSSSGAMLRKTVAVVDMVGYSTIARMLEQNISAASVAELNRQIQGFITHSLEALPEHQSYTVVARTGDGIILLFDSVDAAHWFGTGVHHAAKDHNDHRTETTAQRWFRVGIATGDLSATETGTATGEYAGTTIANAVRLEAAAEAGEILMDDVSFAELSAELQREYGAEEIVKGKREERFQVRRCRVTPRVGVEPVVAAGQGSGKGGLGRLRTDGAAMTAMTAMAALAAVRLNPEEQRRKVIGRIVVSVLYLIALSGLILWEDRDHLNAFTPSCDTAVDGTHSALYSKPYRYFLSRVTGESVTPVAMVAIPGNLAEIQGNVCEGRFYLADLLRSIATQHPAEIVVDKSFGPGTCNFLPEATADLLTAVKSIAVPVVVGESADTAAKERDGACLVRRPQLDFASANVHRGIARLNFENETIPLQWQVQPEEKDGVATATADSLAWAAVKLYDAGFAERQSVKALIDRRRQPFANLNMEIPRRTSTEVMCSYGTPGMRSRWTLACPQTPPAMNLLGKVVLVGSEEVSDRQPVLGTQIWGFELQARYIQALLSGAYLRAIPLWFAFVLFGCYFFLIESVPALLVSFAPHLRTHAVLGQAVRSRRYGWVSFWTVAFIVLISALCLAMGYLPPLAVFGDIVLVALVRLVLFTAKRAERPIPVLKER